MADLLTLSHVGKIFPGGLAALTDFSLSIAEGEFLSLLGPSGCGKTTMLRVIAGFEVPTTGHLILDGQDITALPAYARPVNTVFQDYALFPHMDVTANVGFGLSLRPMSASDRKARVTEALQRVGLSDKTHARIQALSGGQRQRVALARAIVCEPRLLLLDEPLSALDAHLRGQMQLELKRLQRELGMTFILVTHDQTEALSISDRIVVMNKGVIEQVASPSELYDRPATRFVASFIGTMNLLDGRVIAAGNDLRAEAAGLTVNLVFQPGFCAGTACTLGLRPEDIAVVDAASPGSALAKVEALVFQGSYMRLHARSPGGPIVMADLNRAGEVPAIGALVGLCARKEAKPILLPPGA